MYLDHMRRRVKNNDTLLEVFAFMDRNEHGRVSREDVRLYLLAHQPFQAYLLFCSFFMSFCPSLNASFFSWRLV
jgi:hypothetical protein